MARLVPAALDVMRVRLALLRMQAIRRRLSAAINEFEDEPEHLSVRRGQQNVKPQAGRVPVQVQPHIGNRGGGACDVIPASAVQQGDRPPQGTGVQDSVVMHPESDVSLHFAAHHSRARLNSSISSPGKVSSSVSLTCMPFNKSSDDSRHPHSLGSTSGGARSLGLLAGTKAPSGFSASTRQTTLPLSLTPAGWVRSGIVRAERLGVRGSRPMSMPRGTWPTGAHPTARRHDAPLAQPLDRRGCG